MAQLLWGKVYFENHFAGLLRQEPGERFSFQYDDAYLSASHPAIAHTLPLREQSYISEDGLPPFFDNLIAEGWLEQAQKKLLGKRSSSRFERLLTFGYDCAGAVSIIDPDPTHLSDLLIDSNDPKEMALLTNRASLSGIQPKLAIIKEGDLYRPTKIGEISTHIAKFPSSHHPDLIFNEYLTMSAFKALLPDDDVAEFSITDIAGQNEPALLIKRFDRSSSISSSIGRIHFEEFNQLLGHQSSAKYESSYKDMADFIRKNKTCLLAENYRLFRRILAGILVGNTDMHLKNFAMIHKKEGLRLAPIYDQVAAALYDYKTLALSIANATDLNIGRLKAKHIIALGKAFELSPPVINMSYKQLEKTKDMAKAMIADSPIGSPTLKNQLITLMEKRWNGTFALIGLALSKKR